MGMTTKTHRIAIPIATIVPVIQSIRTSSRATSRKEIYDIVDFPWRGNLSPVFSDIIQMVAERTDHLGSEQAKRHRLLHALHRRGTASRLHLAKELRISNSRVC